MAMCGEIFPPGPHAAPTVPPMTSFPSSIPKSRPPLNPAPYRAVASKLRSTGPNSYWSVGAALHTDERVAAQRSTVIGDSRVGARVCAGPGVRGSRQRVAERIPRPGRLSLRKPRARLGRAGVAVGVFGSVGLALISRAVPFPTAPITVEAARPSRNLMGVGGGAPLPFLIAVNLDVGLGALADALAAAVLVVLVALLVVAALVVGGRRGL